MITKEIILEAVNRMNNEPYCKEVIFPYGKEGLIQKLIEIEITRQCAIVYPHYEIHHPADNSGLPDVYSDVLKQGFEIKTTSGYKYLDRHGKEREAVRWVNRAMTDVSDDIIKFLFIKFSIEDNMLIVSDAWYGDITYKDWKQQKRVAYITKNKVNSLCKKII